MMMLGPGDSPHPVCDITKARLPGLLGVLSLQLSFSHLCGLATASLTAIGLQAVLLHLIRVCNTLCMEEEWEKFRKSFRSLGKCGAMNTYRPLSSLAQSVARESGCGGPSPPQESILLFS